MNIRATISRAEAKARGLKRYNTGRPCLRGHVHDRFVSNAICVQCKYQSIRVWCKNKPESRRNSLRKWRDANLEARRGHAQTRRARTRGAEGTHTKADISMLLTKQKNRCLCGVSFDSTSYTIDHIIPLSRGGSNWPDNLQLLCLLCNISKGTKLMCEWVVPVRRAA